MIFVPHLNFFAKHKLDQFCEGRSQLPDDVHYVASVLGIVVLLREEKKSRIRDRS